MDTQSAQAHRRASCWYTVCSYLPRLFCLSSSPRLGSLLLPLWDQRAEMFLRVAASPRKAPTEDTTIQTSYLLSLASMRTIAARTRSLASVDTTTLTSCLSLLAVLRTRVARDLSRPTDVSSEANSRQGLPLTWDSSVFYNAFSTR